MIFSFRRKTAPVIKSSRLQYNLKWTSLHFHGIFSCTESCQNENFQCSQGWKFVRYYISFQWQLYVWVEYSLSRYVFRNAFKCFIYFCAREVLDKGLPTSECSSILYSHGPSCHDDVIKWKHFPRYWPFVWGIHRSPVNSPPKGQWHGAFMFTLICTWINRWVNNREAGDLRRYRAHYDVIVM